MRQLPNEAHNVAVNADPVRNHVPGGDLKFEVTNISTGERTCLSSLKQPFVKI